MAKRTKAQALKTREELIETPIAQFSQHCVSKTTLNDIADAANVTRGAIYWHFENKTQLFNEMWLQQPSLRELIQEHLTAGLEHDPFQQLREKLIVGLQYIAKIPRQQALLKILYHKCEFNDEMLAEGVIREKMGFNPQTLREVLQACQQQGCVANNLVFLFDTLLMQWIELLATETDKCRNMNSVNPLKLVNEYGGLWNFLINNRPCRGHF